MDHQPTVTYFFLGANSKNGFYSLYDHFASHTNDVLHIIKSGPGTGKSTFMKKIGKAAETHGLDVEYILCSGDPQSLDGVYIPALHKGWVDGTSPHIIEPKHFGVDGVYTDLGQFCHYDQLTKNRQSIETLTAAYRLCYQKAYMYLNAAGTLQNEHLTLNPNTQMRIRSRAQAKVKKELSNIENSSLKPIKRFLRALSCQGDYIPDQTLASLCDRICILESHHNLETLFFDEILLEANSRSIFYIQCLNPLSPEHTEAIIFPDIKLCFIAAKSVPVFHGKTRTIHLDTYLESSQKNESKQRDKFIQQLMDAAFTQLSRAKQYHDELEQCYRPALNVQALNEYCDSVLNHLFP